MSVPRPGKLRPLSRYSLLVLAMVHLSFLYILTRYVMRAFLPYLLNRGAKYEYIGVKGRTNESVAWEGGIP